MALAGDDVAVRTSLPLYAKWRDVGHPVELHIFAKGGQGFGMRKQGLPSDAWIELSGTWLLSQGVPVKDVQETAGHSRPSVTLNMYYTSLPGASTLVSKKADELLGE
jgi:hypothetical protein